MENMFASIPEAKTNQWLNILIDLLTMGTLTGLAPFFNGFLKQLPAFASEATFNNAKEITTNIVGQTTTLAKDMLDAPPSDRWTPTEQDKFSNYMSQVILGWRNSARFGVKTLFNGDQKSIDALGLAMANGNFIEGQRTQPAPENTTIADVNSNILKSFFGFSFPALWRHSKTYAFVRDSGSGCDGKPLGKYLADSTANATGVCYEGRLYYLVHPDGEAYINECNQLGCAGGRKANKFSVPVGLGDLSRFQGVTKEDLVIGAVRTWLQNAKTNGGPGIDFSSPTARRELLNVDITTPGFVLLPVCSPDRAFQTWDTCSKDEKNYPCNIPTGMNRCGNSTIENHTNELSPSSSDCLQSIRNIEGNAATEFSVGVVGRRTILSYESCSFGLKLSGGAGGALAYKVGGQDVIDNINEAVNKFGGGGKVIASGDKIARLLVRGSSVQLG